MSFFYSLYSIENDSGFLFGLEDDCIIHTGGEDDWSNTYEYTDTIKKEINRRLSIELDSIPPIYGKVIISFIISEVGIVENAKIEKSLREDVDSILIDIINSFKFNDAPVYSSRGNPYSFNFRLTINIREKKEDKNLVDSIKHVLK